jgi:hypothetical protein
MTPEQRILEMSMLLPEGGAVTGWGSLRLRGGNFFDGKLPDGRTERPVMLTTTEDGYRRDRPGVTFLRDHLDPDEVQVIAGIPCTSVERALFDESRMAEDLRESVVAVDMATAAELTSISRMRAYVDRHARWAGVPQVRAALERASERSASPNETRTRMIWEIDAGFPRPLVNQPVWDLKGNLLGIADLLDADAGVVGEFDGADHRGARRHSSDVDREGRFRGERLEFFRVTGLNLLDRPLVTRRMVTTRGRGLWLPAGRRSWTLVPPSDWKPKLCLDDKLDDRDLSMRWELNGYPDIQELRDM